MTDEELVRELLWHYKGLKKLMGHEGIRFGQMLIDAIDGSLALFYARDQELIEAVRDYHERQANGVIELYSGA